MALLERYFAVTAAGDGTGSSVANAAALFVAGNWSSVITGFDYSANGLRCRILPGAYTCAQSLTTAVTSVADPSVTLPLILHGADADGDLLTPPDPNWQSCQPDWDTAAGWDSTDWPIIATTGNLYTIGLPHTLLRMMKFTASGTTGNDSIVYSASAIDWCSILNTSASANARGISASLDSLTNSIVRCSGSTYDFVCTLGSGTVLRNTRVVGGGSSGNRNGVVFGATTVMSDISGLCIVDCGGIGFVYLGSSTGVRLRLSQCVIANNGGDGIAFPDTAAQAARSFIDRCLITGNGGYGINPGGANTNLVVTNCHLRDNTSGNFGTFGNYPTDLNNDVTDSTDATEYVDAANGDYRIKAGAAIWGKGYGVADEAEPTLPAVGDVQSGSGTFGYGSGVLAPTMTLPTEAQVQDAVQFGAGGTEFTGAYDPSAAAVYPAEANVLEAESAYGPTGAEYAGTYHAPEAAEVIDTAVFGPASGTAGTYHAPDAAEVWHEAVFGDASGTAGTFVGSDITNLEAGNIKDGVQVDDVLGTYAVASGSGGGSLVNGGLVR